MEIKDIRLSNLHRVLEANGLTQTELALSCGISPSLVSQIVTKRRNMGSSLARKLEEKLKLTDGWFDLPHSLIDAPHGIEVLKDLRHEREDRPKLSRQEIRLLKLFRQMPESEKNNIITQLSLKKREYDKLLDELIAVKSELYFNEDDENHNKNNG